MAKRGLGSSSVYEAALWLLFLVRFFAAAPAPAAAAPAPPPPPCVALSPFASGSFPVSSFSIPRAEGPPLPLLVFAPRLPKGQPGPGPIAPAVVFLHGFNLQPGMYSQMLTQIASHGFVVVAPQFDFTLSSDATPEITASASVIQWLRSNYVTIAPGTPTPALPADFANLAIAGHSRGGKDAYGVALGLGGSAVHAKAVVVLDPVDGTSSTSQTTPKILKYQANSLKLNASALVVGTGLGPQRWGIFPACALAGVAHTFFHSDTASPAYHVRAADYGHADMLNNGGSSVGVCLGGRRKELMRQFCAGVTVAFLKYVLQSSSGCFQSLLNNSALFPIFADQIYKK